MVFIFRVAVTTETFPPLVINDVVEDSVIVDVEDVVVVVESAVVTSSSVTLVVITSEQNC